jgi:hypothetical protein
MAGGMGTPSGAATRLLALIDEFKVDISPKSVADRVLKVVLNCSIVASAATCLAAILFYQF